MTFGDIIVLSVIALAVAFVIAGMVRDRKKGKHCGSCSGCAGCSSCASCGSCNTCKK